MGGSGASAGDQDRRARRRSFHLPVLDVGAIAGARATLRGAARPAGRQARFTEPLSNIRVHGVLVPLVSALLAKSETFCRQWDVISASRFIRVTVVSRLGMQDPGSARARAEVSRDADGAIRATIEVPGATDLTELLPHEFEHVIEPLEGLDLRALARRHKDGVVEVRTGVFESARARAAGLQVYREVYGETDPAIRGRVWRAQAGLACVKNPRTWVESAPGQHGRASGLPS